MLFSQGKGILANFKTNIKMFRTEWVNQMKEKYNIHVQNYFGCMINWESNRNLTYIQSTSS